VETDGRNRACLSLNSMGKKMHHPDIQALADALCREAGLIGPWGHATPQMVALMQGTASRCLDILNGSGRDSPRYAEIARRFGASSAIDPGHANIHCRAVLKEAPGLTASERSMAEGVFAEAMCQKLGGMAGLFRDHSDWADDPRSDGGRRWQAASEIGWLLVQERLRHGGGRTIDRTPAGRARFEMEFIHEIA
jgi:hypothetical protein